MVAVVEADLRTARGDECAKCAHEAAERAVVPRERDDHLVPWGIALTGAVLVASVGAAADRWFGLGAIAGISIAAGCAWFTVRSFAARTRAAHERELAKMVTEGDERVAMVVRQFEWAVNDVVKQKREIERADASADLLVGQARQRERYVQRLEQQLFEARERITALMGTPAPAERIEFDPLADAMAGIIPFNWSIHSDKFQVNLELECGLTSRRPSRVRLIDADGNVLMTSGTPMWSDEGRPCFTLAQPPTDLVLDLDAGREVRYRFEALADYEWRQVRLEDSGRRTKIVTDKQGRMYRVADEPDVVQLLAPPTTLH